MTRVSCFNCAVSILLVGCALLNGCKSKSPDRADAIPGGSLTGGNSDRGGALYVTHCSGCHGVSGKGDGPGAKNINPKPVDHTDRQFMASMANAHLFTVIRQGGAVVGKNAMPPFPTLSDDEIRDLIAFMRSIAH